MASFDSHTLKLALHRVATYFISCSAIQILPKLFAAIDLKSYCLYSILYLTYKSVFTSQLQDSFVLLAFFHSFFVRINPSSKPHFVKWKISWLEKPSFQNAADFRFLIMLVQRKHSNYWDSSALAPCTGYVTGFMSKQKRHFSSVYDARSKYVRDLKGNKISQRLKSG